jgi:hypothetical protein
MVRKMIRKEAFSDQGSISPTCLLKAFIACRSQKCKMIKNLTVIIALMGSTRMKAAHKMLMKLTPRGNPVKGILVIKVTKLA